MKDTTILVIDDEPSNIQIINNILQNANSTYKVISSSNSRLGIEIALHTKPDIIITDWQMPDIDGIGVIKAIKENQSTTEIPIIMATGIMISSADLKLALESGAFDFIRKPLDEIELMARINSALRNIDYHNEKLNHEIIQVKLQEEIAQAKIDSQKKELLSKTMLLLRISQLNEKFQESLKRNLCEKEMSSCVVYNFAKSQINDIVKSGKEQIWNELEIHFEQMNDSFYKNLSVKFPELTLNEKKLCAYLRLNLATKDISSITLQSPRSIEIARTRLREKLGIRGLDIDLHSFLLNF